MGRGGEPELLATFKSSISSCIVMVGRMTPRDRIVAVEYWNDVSAKLQAVVDGSVEELEQAFERQDSPLPSQPQNGCEGGAQSNGDDKQQGTASNCHEDQSNMIPCPPMGLEIDPKYQLIVPTSPSLGLAEVRVMDPSVENQNEAVILKQENLSRAVLLQNGNVDKWKIDPSNVKEPSNVQDIKQRRPAMLQEQPSLLLKDIRREQQSLLLDRRSEQVVTSSCGGNTTDPQQRLLLQDRKPEQQSLLLQKPLFLNAGKGDFDENMREREALEDEDEGRSNLSGHVVVVGEEGQQEITVTGQDGLRHKVHIQIEEEDDGSGEEEEEQEITEAMKSVECVTIDGNPAPVDESVHRVARCRPDGAYEVVYQCELCGKAHVTAAGLTSHRWQHTKPFQCERCKQRFASKGNLVIHRRRHTGEKPFGCHLCNSRFSTKGNLKRHIQTHSGIKPWACDQCEGRFTEKKSLKIHMRKHTGERPYSCTVCGKTFAQTSILRSHLAMHMDKRAHLCDLCGRSFRQKSQLRLHVQRHSGMKKFDCVYCESKFLTKGDLERHVKSHMGTRDFTCELCQKTFTRQQTLNEHMNRHYGLKPYECKVCGRAFSEMSTVYKHIKTHDHQKKEEFGSMDEQVIVRQLPDDVRLCDVVNPNVTDGPVEEGLVDECGVKEERLKDEKEQFIYLETTGMDGSISITEATVDNEGNLRIGPEGL